MVHEVYEEVRFKVYENDVYDETKKPQERQPRDANLFIF
jgi:hypothetical protein